MFYFGRVLIRADIKNWDPCGPFPALPLTFCKPLNFQSTSLNNLYETAIFLLYEMDPFPYLLYYKVKNPSPFWDLALLTNKLTIGYKITQVPLPQIWLLSGFLYQDCLTYT